MPGFNVAELMATYRVVGATTAVRDLESIERAFAASGAAAADSAADLSANEKAMAAQARAAANSSSMTSKQRAAILSATAAIARYNELLDKGDASLARMSSAEASVVRSMQRVTDATTSAAAATDEFAAAQKTAAVESRGFASGAASMLKTVGGFAIFAGALEAAKAAIDIGKDASAYQRQMLQIQTLTGQSSTEVKNMSSAVLGLAGQVGTAPDQLAVSLYHVEQNGLHGAQALDVVKTAAEGAKIGMADVEDTTNSMTSAVASGIKGVQNMDQAMGALLATVGTGDMKMSDLNEALGSGILSVAKTYGLSLKDVGASLATFGDLNIRGSNAASDLRQAIMAFAKPAAGPAAKDAMDKLGISTDTLAKDMQKGGLNKAVTDLRDRLNAAGITGDKVGKALLDLFGKKAGIGVSILVDQYGRLQTKYAELDKGSQSFADKWSETTKTVAFQFDQLGAEAEAAGISFMTKALPAASALAKVLFGTLTTGITVASDALHPFVQGFEVIAPTLGKVGGAVAQIVSGLGPLVPVLGATTAAALAMWAAFKGYQLARDAVLAMVSAVEAGSERMALAGTRVQAYGAGVRGAFAGNASEATLTSQIMQAEFAKVEAAAMAEAATIARTAAQIDEAYAQMIIASDDATATMISNSQNQALASAEAAASAEASAAETAASAQAASDAVVASGDEAALGWGAIAGPIGIAVAGAAVLATTFLHMGSSAKSNAADVQSLTDAINQDSGALGANTRAAIGHALVTSGAAANAKTLGMNLGELTDAVMSGGQPLAAYIQSLGLMSGTMYGSTKDTSKQTAAARELANELTSGNSDLNTAVKNVKLYGQTQADTADATTESAAAVKTSASSLGESSTAYKAAQAAASANTAQTLAQTQAFQAENDAASLLQQSLNGLAGINLSVASALTSVRSANLSVASSFKTNKTAIDGASQAAVNNQGAIQQQVQAAQQYAEAIGKQTDSSVKAKAAFAAQKQSLEDQLRATGNLTPAVQKYIDQLYNIANLKVPPTKLDVDRAAKKAAMEALANFQSTVNLLHGKTVSVYADVSGAAASVQKFVNTPSMKYVQVVTIPANGPASGGHTDMPSGHATGGTIGDGPSGTVHGSGSPNVDSVLAMLAPGEEVIRASQANKHRTLLKAINAGTAGFKFGGTVPGYASGGIVHSGKNWIYNGIRYASERAAQNAETSHLRSLAKAQASAQKSLLNTVGGDTRGVVGLAAAGNVSSLTTKLTSLRTALSDAGVKSSWISKIAGDSTKLEQATSALSKASAALAAAKAVKATDVANTKAGITGSFDITSAGQDASTGAVTGGSILAASKQAVTRAKAFYNGLTKLTDEKVLPADYIRAIAAKGPDDLPEVTALLSLPKASLHQLNLDNAALNSKGSALGNTVGSVLDNGAISKAQATLSKDKATVNVDEKALAKAITGAMLDVGFVAQTKISGGDILVLVKTAEKQAAKTRGKLK